MNEKGKTPARRKRAIEDSLLGDPARAPQETDPHERLRELIVTMGRHETLASFREFALIKAERDGKPLERPLYPLSFLEAVKDTGFHALRTYLMGREADPAAIELLDELSALVDWIGEIEKGQGLVGFHVNMGIADNLKELTHHMAEVGSEFYGPYGPVFERDMSAPVGMSVLG